jgi:hypothetical protein
MTHKPTSPCEPDVVVLEAEDPAPAPAARASQRTIERTAHVRVREIVRASDSGRRVRARGTRDAVAPGEQISTLVFAPGAERAAWIEAELSRAPISISIQVGRRVRTVISALVRDPPPRPHVLIVDFDAVSPAEVLELHAVRHEGWPGRLIALGSVPLELRASLEIEQVLDGPLVRDSLLDIVAGTRHADTTVPIPSHMLAELAPSGRSRR